MPLDPTYYLRAARIYKIFSVFFLFVGLCMFFVFYTENIDGRLLEALKEPYTLFWIIFAFSPAIILSQLSYNAFKKYKSTKSR